MEDAKRCICAEVIMRFYLIKNMGFCNSEIDIEYNTYGKPVLKGRNLYFSLSHSNRWVVCGWNNNEIGVDIEKISKINIDIAKLLFCETEYKYIISGGQYEQYKRFMQIWTLKESYIKYVGKGLSIPLNSFCIKKNANGLTIESENNREKLYLKQVEFSDGYFLAECSGDKSCIEVQEITLEELMTVFCD
ncbi:MAG: 4'-phosphopantetheinyl transferase superfamily protein [Clostridiales bacterium]|nr:4'-phosphopantetheinyl transferase superfamily protein [Clostridiales bacterium]